MADADRTKALDNALAQIERNHGKGSVMRLGDRGKVPVEVIPTGSIALDIALGIGGLPRGRVVEIYGPESSGKTTVALHAVANAQRAGGIAAFIDAEHALDPEYAQKLGVDTDALLVSQPDSGEQALEIADMLIRSGALDIIVIDSVAALVPRAEIEGEMGDSHVGLQARLMSQALRKLTSAISNSGTTAVFINQLREKIGVMFGCFSGDTRVVLGDGTTKKIGAIVNQKLPVEVMSYDPRTNQVVPRRVVNWFDNGPTDHFLQFTVEKSAGNGRSQFGVTDNHLVRTPGGWREAGELIVGDRVLAAETHRLSDQQWQVVLGSLLGDGNLSPNRRDRNSVRFRLGHGARQAAYLDWKVSLLGNIACSRRSNAKGAVFADFAPLPELGELQRSVYLGDGKRTISEEYLKALTPLALAIWYMDDGGFTLRSKGVQQCTGGGTGRVAFGIEALSVGSRDRLVTYLRDTHGLDVSWRETGAARQAVLTFTTAASTRFRELVAPYVHPSMAYKLLPRLAGQFEVTPELVEPKQLLVPARILDIHVKPKTRSMDRFDIEVEGSHNYLVDGVMVHNSPETTTGGKALKFYASVRLDVRRIESLKDGTDFVGNRTRIKVVKNKCLAEGTRVFDPVTGQTHPIEDIVDGQLPVHVVSARKDGVLETRQVTSWFDQGEQQVIGLRVSGGAELWVTPDHKIMTPTGWREASKLTAGDEVAGRRRGSQSPHLAEPLEEPVLSHLRASRVSPAFVAETLDLESHMSASGLRQLLGTPHLRRDRVQMLADALDDVFLKEILADQLVYLRVSEVLPARRARTFDVEVDELHNLVAEDVLVHNCAPPFKQAEFDIMYGLGISREGSLIDVGVDTGLVRKAGAWYTYEGDQLGQGKENARNFLRDNPDLANELEKRILEQLGIGAQVDDEDAPEPTNVDF